MTRPFWAWTIAAFVVLSALADMVITLKSRSLLSEATIAQHGFPFVDLAVVAASVMGAVIVSRYPRHLVGWLLVASGAVGAFSLVAEAWSIWIAYANGPGSAHLGHLLGWISKLVAAPQAIALLSLVFLTAPDGHLLSPRWRWAGVASVIGATVYTVGILTVPPDQVIVDRSQDFGRLPTVLDAYGVALLLAGTIASLFALVLRRSRATGELRQQLRWITLSAAAIPAGLVWSLALRSIGDGQQNWLNSLPLFLAYVTFPVSVAIAVLRHRLYDLDVIINRAVLLTLLTAFVLVGYVVVVVAAGAALGQKTSFLPSLVATAVIALAFQPLRGHVVRLADRFAYGERAVPYEELAEFSRSLGESPAPDALLPAVAHAAAQAVRARAATVRLHVGDGAALSATWPRGETEVDSDAAHVDVVDNGEQLGDIAVRMPPGRELRAHDTVLLTDLADQASIAFRNTRLASDLDGEVRQLVEQANALVRSRARLIQARDDEQRRLERSIQRDVLPHLAPLPGTLDRFADPGHLPSPREIDLLLVATTEALEALREITRGVFPPQLIRSGLAAAMGGHLSRSDVTGVLQVADSAAGRRFGPRVEATAYFCYVEATRELQGPLTVGLAAADDELVLDIRGVGSMQPSVDSISDRVEAAEGTFLTELGRIQVRLPIPADQVVAARHTPSSRSEPKSDLIT